MLAALDFDGTLAPIVARPEDGAPLAGIRELLRSLATRADTRVAIVSGRGMADARQRVGVRGVYYAGNHGLEIHGPGVDRVHEEAAAAEPRLAALADRLRVALGGVAGAQVEDKGLTLSVHYRRLADPDRAGHVVRAVRAAAATVPGVRLTEGKMVVEIRPDVDWDKGHAALFLVDALLADTPDAPAFFIGDDRTDEDAFAALAGRGPGILVADAPPGRTRASAWLRSPEEVLTFLRALDT